MIKLYTEKRNLLYLFLLISFMIISCGKSVDGIGMFKAENSDLNLNRKSINDIEKKFRSNALVDIHDIDTSIKVRLAYSTEKNFTGINLYGDFNKCFLPEIVAKKLTTAQDCLKAKRPDLSLLILDATRPRSVQQLMWDTCKIPTYIKAKYLARPSYTSMHNYGGAIDLTLVNNEGLELDMGTPFDFFGNLSEPRMESFYLSLGKLTNQQIDNRKILRNVMISAGFIPIPNEWWHFDAGSRTWVKENLKLIE